MSGGVQVQGLLPDPFPATVATRRRKRLDHVIEPAAFALMRVPGVARRVMRRPGGSMVVVTEYGFDVAGWRARAGRGPETIALEIGCAGRRAAWDRLPLELDVRLRLDDEGPPGIRRIVLRADPSHPRSSLRIGDLELAFEES